MWRPRGLATVAPDTITGAFAVAESSVGSGAPLFVTPDPKPGWGTVYHIPIQDVSASRNANIQV